MILPSRKIGRVCSPAAIVHFLIFGVINRRLSNAHGWITYGFKIDSRLMIAFIDAHHLRGAVVLEGGGRLHGRLRHQRDQGVALMVVHLQVRGGTLRGEVMVGLVD